MVFHRRILKCYLVSEFLKILAVALICINDSIFQPGLINDWRIGKMLIGSYVQKA